jgi:hypothetical protein
VGQDEQLDKGFYARMLPPKERGAEAFGGLLSGIGAALSVAGVFILPMLLCTPGVLLAGAALVTVRSKDAERRFGMLFALSCVAWFVGFAHAAISSKALY